MSANDKPSERELADGVLNFLMQETGEDCDSCVRILVATLKAFQLGIDMRDSGGSYQDFERGMEGIMNELDTHTAARVQ